MPKKKSLKERLALRREEIENKSGSFKTFILPKPGITRFRNVPVGEENDWAMEVVYFFPNKEIGMVVSAKTFGEPCSWQDAFEELKNSKKEADRKFSEKIKPKRGYVTPVFRYKDEKGKQVDTENGVKLLVLKGDQYQNMLDAFLDDDLGDFTKFKSGYDFKHKRVGTGQFDTKYSSMPAPKNGLPTPKEYRGPYDLEKMVRELIPTKKESKRLLEQFLSIPPDDDDDDKPKKKKKAKRDI